MLLAVSTISTVDSRNLISDDVQWDIQPGTGLNDAADDFFVGTGLAIRFR